MDLFLGRLHEVRWLKISDVTLPAQLRREYNALLKETEDFLNEKT
jgi:hypothetical protein